MSKKLLWLEDEIVFMLLLKSASLFMFMDAGLLFYFWIVQLKSKMSMIIF